MGGHLHFPLSLNTNPKIHLCTHPNDSHHGILLLGISLGFLLGMITALVVVESSRLMNTFGL